VSVGLCCLLPNRQTVVGVVVALATAISLLAQQISSITNARAESRVNLAAGVGPFVTKPLPLVRSTRWQQHRVSAVSSPTHSDRPSSSCDGPVRIGVGTAQCHDQLLVIGCRGAALAYSSQRMPTRSAVRELTTYRQKARPFGLVPTETKPSFGTRLSRFCMAAADQGGSLAPHKGGCLSHLFVAITFCFVCYRSRLRIPPCVESGSLVLRSPFVSYLATLPVRHCFTVPPSLSRQSSTRL